MDEETGITGWVLSGIGAIIATLTSVIAMFYKTQISDYKANEMKLETEIKELKESTEKKILALQIASTECEQDRTNIRIKYAVLEQRVTDLEVTKQNRDSIG